jgi:hypothetical protein
VIPESQTAKAARSVLVGVGRFPYKRSMRPTVLTTERLRWLLERPEFRNLPEGTQVELVRMLVLHANALGAFYPSVKKATDPRRGNRQVSRRTLQRRLRAAVAAGVLYEFPWLREGGRQAPTVYVFALGRTMAEVVTKLRAAGCTLEPARVTSAAREGVSGGTPTVQRGDSDVALERSKNESSFGTGAHGTAVAGRAPSADPHTERQAR